MWGHGHWSNVLIKILVALFIFWCGIQFGELRGYMRGGYYDQGTDQGYSQYRGGPGMMYFYR
jgi:hypothetical protein